MTIVELSFIYLATRAAQDPHRRGRARATLLPLLVGSIGPIANLFFVTAVLYVLWTPLGSPSAQGVQIRYFLGSTIVMIAVVFAALNTVFPAHPCVEAAKSTPRTARRATALSALVILGVVLHVSPYIAKVFVELIVRYG
jgi:hypothetical protein